MKTPNDEYSCKNGYLQIVIHRGRASACGEKFTVMTACNTFGKRPCGWGAQKPCVIRAEARIDFTSLTRSVFTCSKRLLFEQPYYRKFTVTCGCNPNQEYLRNTCNFSLQELMHALQRAFLVLKV